MTLGQVRVAAVVAGLLALALALHRRQRLAAVVREFMLEPSSAFNLGALRIVIFAMIFDQARSTNAAFFAGLPAALRSMPAGLGWLEHLLPFDPAIAVNAERALMIASGLATVGLATRVFAPLAAVLGLYVMGLPNFYVKLNHGAHGIAMCSIVLAFSACGDALSCDRLWQRWRGYAAPRPATEYTIPVRFCWLLLGTVYLFPGLWKLWQCGDLWLNGLRLKSELYEKWGQFQQMQPPARIDKWPWLLSALGASTLIFEIGFFFALFNRYSRVVAAFSAVAFHLGVLYFMFIRFHVWLPLVLLLDFPQLWQLLERHLPARLRAAVDARRAPRLAPERQPSASATATANAMRALPRRSRAWPSAAGSLLLVGQFVTGVAGIQSWPIALHPTFSTREQSADRRATRVRVLLEPAAGGPAQDLDDSMKELGRPRLRHLLRKLKAVAKNRKRLHQEGRMFTDILRSSGVAVVPGDLIVLYEARWDVFPIGERANYYEVMNERFSVNDDYSLVLQPTLRNHSPMPETPQRSEPDDD